MTLSTVTSEVENEPAASPLEEKTNVTKNSATEDAGGVGGREENTNKLVKKTTTGKKPKTNKTGMATGDRPKAPTRPSTTSASPGAPKRKAPARSKSDGGPATGATFMGAKRKAGVNPKSTGGARLAVHSNSKLPSKARTTSKSPINSIDAAGQVGDVSRSSRLIQSKAASMMHVKPPKPSNTMNPPMLQRARSNDVDNLGRRKAPSLMTAPSKRKIPARSRSSDLENLVGSTVKDQRTGVPPRSSLISENSQRSILRNSTHGGTRQPPSSLTRQSSVRARFTEDIAPRNLAAGAISSSGDASIEAADFDDDSVIEIEQIKFNDEPMGDPSSHHTATKPRAPRPGMYSRPGMASSRSGLTKSKSLMDLSGHSYKSTLDLMSLDKTELWPNDPIWKKTLRYIRILPPHPQERPERRWVRIYAWAALFLDFIAAVVSLTTYSGVTTCCGEPMFSLLFLNINWTQLIRIVTYIYIVLIFAEVIPVVRGGIPFNLVNPIIGFLITFAVFFDSRIVEAILMWVIEVSSVFFEVLIYRLHSKLYHGRYDKLDELEKNLTSTRNIILSSQRALKTTSSSSGRASLPELSEDDDSASSVHSFEGDDVEVAVPSRMSKKPTQFNASSTSLGLESNHKYREARLLRERRQLRLKQKEDRKKLNYHVGGVMINLVLVSICFILIVVIASSGGLCIKSGERPRVFSMDQLGICNDCPGNIVNGLCEVCDAEVAGDYECYYQYL